MSSVEPESAMADLPSHQWQFKEASGPTALDDIGDSNGTLSFANRVSPGRVGISAIEIDGSDDSFVSFPSRVGQFDTAAFTIAFWIQTSEALRLFDLIGNRTAFSGGNFLSIRMTGDHDSRRDGTVIAEIDDGGGAYAGVTSNVGGLNNGDWHHIAVTRQSQVLSIYVDGQPAGSTSGPRTARVHNANPVKLGRSLVASGVPRFAPAARFDDIRIYAAALDAHEIASMNTWGMPEERALVFAMAGVLRVPNGYMSSASGAYLATASDGRLFSSANDRSVAALFSLEHTIEGFLASVNGKYVRILADGKLSASGTSRADATPFLPYLLETGALVWTTPAREAWRLEDDFAVSAKPALKLELRNAFSLSPVLSAHAQVLESLGPKTLDPPTDCDIAWAKFVWQLNAGLFLALGLGPFIYTGEYRPGLWNFLRDVPTAKLAVQHAYSLVVENEQASATAGVMVLDVIWRNGLLWSVFTWCVNQAGYKILFNGVAYVLKRVFATPTERTEVLASLTVWSHQLYLAALDVREKCPLAEAEHGPRAGLPG